MRWFYFLWAKLTGRNHDSTPPSMIIDQMNEPRPLPMGMADFDSMSDRIISGALLPGDKALLRDSQRFAIAEMIMHLKPTEDHVADAYFIHSLRKGAANQIAFSVIEDFQNKKRARIQAIQDKMHQEAHAKDQEKESDKKVVPGNGVQPRTVMAAVSNESLNS